ncbi:two-component regulator propeller domain-containing protein [Porphyromonas gingivicanis]|uniref:two-component regulator propeller domain-containing protein n=1 Tax=Porphyromonas gingivicanis TaxID=266762 RepID=UPI000472B632|nr:two-component regulator propeller domain-containing protein [Porphyromonas gingivicanis]
MNRLFYLVVAITLSLLPHQVQAQDFWTITNTANTSSGLPSDEVLSIQFDRNGKLWIGTNLALASFDGTNWKVYGEEDGLTWGNVRLGKLRIDSKQNVWICSEEAGLARVGADGKVTMFLESEELDDAHIASNILFDIVEDEKGGFWISNWAQMGTTLSYLSPEGKFTHYHFTTLGNNPFDKLLSLAYDKQTKTLYGGSLFQGVVKFDGQLFTPITENYQTAVSDLLIDEGNRLLYGASDIGLIRYELEGEKTVKLLTTEEGLPDNFTTSVAIAKDGSLWVGTDGAGVAHIKEGKSTIYNTTNGLSSNDIYSIAFNPQNEIYFGTHIGGICYRDTNDVWHYMTSSGLASNDVVDMLFNFGGKDWYATVAGLSSFDGKLWKNYTLKGEDGKGFPSNYIATVCPNLNDETQKTLHVGTKGGVATLNLETNSWTTYPVEAKDKEGNPVFPKIKAYQFEKDKIWLCTFGAQLGFGILDLTTKEYRFYTDKNLDVLPKGCNSFFEIKQAPDASVWIGSVDGALVYKDGAYRMIDFTTETEMVNPNTGAAETVKDNNVRNFAFAPDGKVWVSKLSGLVIYDPVTDTKVHETGPVDNPMSILTSIVFDGEGNAFIGTLLDGLFLRTKNGVYKHLGTNYGLSNKLMVYNTYFRDEHLVLTTDAGVFVAHKPKDIVEKALSLNSMPEEDRLFHLYPNPSDNIVYFPKSTLSYTLYTQSGQLIRSGNAHPIEQIEVGSLPRGVYFVKYQVQGIWVVEKLVVK